MNLQPTISRNIAHRWHRFFPWVALVLAALLLSGTNLLAEEYSANGKRDPFVPVRSEQVREFRPPEPPPLAQRPPGLAGLLISEVTVTGTAANRNRNLVILKGIDDVSYIAGSGTKLFDGFLERVAPTEVIFVREKVTRQGKQPERVVKNIFTEQR